MFEDFIDLAKQIRRSEAFKNALNSPSRLSLHLKQHFNHGYFAIEICANSGFFSVMQIVLCILLYCEEKNLTPFISARGGSYGDAQGKVDWLAECFENIAHSATPRDSNLRLRTSRVEDLGNLGFRRYESGLQLTHASTVFLSQYRPAPSIRTEVDTTCRRLGIGPSTLGVHFRGTDKKYEAHVIEQDAFCRMVEKTLSDHPHLTNIFVSSDEQTFLDFFKNWGFAVPVDIAPATMLANGEKPVHFSGHPGLAIGREALITSLLLSSCGYLIKTPSYLSAWSRIFNPSLPVRLVAPPRANAFWFPDSQIWLEQENHGREQAGLQIDALASNSPFVGTSATS